MQNIWIVESNEDFPYRSTGYLTRAEARFRLRDLADEPYTLADGTVTRTAARQADDFIVTPDGVTYRVVRWCSVRTIR